MSARDRYGVGLFIAQNVTFQNSAVVFHTTHVDIVAHVQCSKTIHSPTIIVERRSVKRTGNTINKNVAYIGPIVPASIHT
jgi:hypothetical protein